MKCKWESCENEARGKSPFCGGTCKKRYQRASGTKPELSGTSVPVEAKVGQVGQTAPSTQNTGEQEAGEYTKSDEMVASSLPDEVMFGYVEPTHIDKVILAAFGINLPGDKKYKGCVTQERIDASRRSRSQPAQAAPVDESEVTADVGAPFRIA